MSATIPGRRHSVEWIEHEHGIVFPHPVLIRPGVVALWTGLGEWFAEDYGDEGEGAIIASDLAQRLGVTMVITTRSHALAWRAELDEVAP